MAEPRTAVIHLVRRANGRGALEDFLTAYRSVEAGTPHRLVLATKGYEDLDEVRDLWGDLDPVVLNLPDRGYDLGSYLLAAERLAHDHVCLVNSFARPSAPTWLDQLLAASEQPGVGAAAATASHESLSDERRLRRRYHLAGRFLAQYGMPEHVPGFPPFPNPHLRTNALCLRRDLLLDLQLAEPVTKLDAYLIESGPQSLTARVQSRGLRAVVVPDGRPAVDVSDARNSCTFRWGGQCALLVKDNATDQYAAAGRGQRRRLQKLAWGANGR